MKPLVLLSLAALAATPAFAETGRIEGKALVLELGQSATVAISANGPVMADASTLKEIDERPIGEAMGFDFKWDETLSGTTLVIANGYDKAVDIDAEIYAANGHHEPTSICVVIPRGSNHEMWPYRIAKIEISKFKFTDMSNEMRCD